MNINLQIMSKIKKIKETQLKRRNDNNILYYNNGEKIHKKQLEFAKNQARNRWVFGGNRSGKTECGAVEAVWLARGIHPYRPNRNNCMGWVVSISKTVGRDVAQAKILDYINPDWITSVVMDSGSASSMESGVIDFITIKNVLGGESKIAFKSCEMGRDKFVGTSLDWVWFDEEPPYDIYQECCMRVLDRLGYIWGTMTPLCGLTWVYDKIYLNTSNDKDVWHIFMEWADNPFLDKAEIGHLTDMMSADEIESRRYGRFKANSGLVYKEFDDNTHVIRPFKIPKSWYHSISIDPGLKNPLSAHWYAVDDDGVVFVIAEHYQAEKDIAYHAQCMHDISQRLDWHTDKYGRLTALMDSAANQHTLSSQKSVAELFYNYNINVNTNINKDLFSGINTVKRYLEQGGQPKLYIFDNCVNLISEIKQYWWGDNDRPKKQNDHALDELRYFLMFLDTQIKTRSTTPKTIIQKHKDYIMKRTIVK